MKNNIETFLLDNEKNDQIFPGDYHPTKIHKERYDDRFIILYTKDCHPEHFEQNNYEVAGYYDTKDKCIYNYNYDLRSLLREESLIKTNSFSVLSEKMWAEIEDYINNYSFSNEEELKKIAQDKFDNLEDYRKNNYKSEVREIFIEKENPSIKLEKSYSSGKLTNTNEYYHKNIYVNYLNNPTEVVSKYANEIINSNKEGLGLELLIYYDKISYLNSIKVNENHTFDSLYINREMYKSIKDIDAKTLNITIHYGGKDLTFKYEYSTLKRDLLNDNQGSGGYGVAYEKVSDFIKENSHDSESSRWRNDFLFSHVTSITYGKKELYHCDYKEENIEKEQEDIEIEM